MAVPPPDTPFYRKIAAIERHYGMDKLSVELLMKIARYKVPHLPAERWAAVLIMVLIIWCHKLPIPVPMLKPELTTDEGGTK